VATRMGDSKALRIGSSTNLPHVWLPVTLRSLLSDHFKYTAFRPPTRTPIG
jgi:hypothetical protein